MTRFHDKVEGRTKQIVGHMVGDDQLIAEGQAQERTAGDGQHESEAPQHATRDHPTQNRD